MKEFALYDMRRECFIDSDGALLVYGDKASANRAIRRYRNRRVVPCPDLRKLDYRNGFIVFKKTTTPTNDLRKGE